MPRDPLAWYPLFRHWTHCLGKGGDAISRLGDLRDLPNLNLAELLPGGPGWVDVQRNLQHDPEGAFRLLYYGLALRGLESLPTPERLALPNSIETPQISVLIPVHNHWSITLNALRSLVAMANSTSFEVIVADDASTDATTQLGRQLPWLRVWRGPVNQGFLDTCNSAATMARGELLLLLNNDTLVGDHALDQLAESFKRHPDAGVVGAAFWGADGLPQEMGGIVWANGQVWNHGRGFPPRRWFALEYERQCDYVSGCGLAIRKQLWEQLSGFDPRYRPAYCEDTDLCLRVREMGLNVWVQPAARVLHLEGLSHSRSSENGLKAHQGCNLEKFRRQWQYTLDTEQPPHGHSSLLAADRILLGRPIALLLQPSGEEIEACRNKGYGVLALGKSPQTDVISLPLAWQDLARWLLEQLPEQGGPDVVLTGTLVGLSGELARRLQEARPKWVLTARASELPSRLQAMRLPALPNWDREDMRILASSTGLHEDGWLETLSRLVIQLPAREECRCSMCFELYAPKHLLLDSYLTITAQIEGATNTFTKVLKAGLNALLIDCSEVPVGNMVVIGLRSSSWLHSNNSLDQRRLLATLADVKVLIGSGSDA